MAPPEPSFMSKLQGPMQAILRPGQWCFGVRAIRQGEETWEVSNSSPQAVVDAVASKVGDFQGSESGLVGSNKIRLGKKSDVFLRLESYTATAEWLDVVELHASDLGSGRVSVRVKSFSSGLCPTLIPCSTLLSAAFFWLPFSDMTPDGGMNLVRIKEIREAVADKLTVERYESKRGW